MRAFHHFIFACFFGTLAGCNSSSGAMTSNLNGGTNGGNPTGTNTATQVAPISASVGPNTVTAVIDPATNVPKFAINGTDIGPTVLATNAYLLKGGIAAYSDTGQAPNPLGLPPIPVPRRFGFIAQTAGSVVALAATNTGTVAETSGQHYARLVSTDLPTSGSARYNGGYAATFNAIDGAGREIGVVGVITGTATLDADLAKQTVEGNITDRAFYPSVTGTISVADVPANLRLQPANIDANGRFAGVTSGTGFNPTSSAAPWNAGSGTYEGAISGATGNEIIGAATTQWTNPSQANTFSERGIFIGSD